MSCRLRDAAAFADRASLWAIALGLLLGWGSYFVTGSGFWRIVIVLAASAFAGGLISHLIFEGSCGLLRATLAGGGAPICATLAGALISGWGAWLPLALHGFETIGLLFALPGAIYGLLYGIAIKVIRRNRRSAP